MRDQASFQGLLYGQGAPGHYFADGIPFCTMIASMLMAVRTSSSTIMIFFCFIRISYTADSNGNGVSWPPRMEKPFQVCKSIIHREKHTIIFYKKELL
jgi:hypothetical protein